MIKMVAVNNTGPYNTGESFWSDTPKKCRGYAVPFKVTPKPVSVVQVPAEPKKESKKVTKPATKGKITKPAE